MNFVKFCKSSENKRGYISNSFFFNMIKTKAKIISGPLKNIILNIIDIDVKIIANSGEIKISIKKIGNTVILFSNKIMIKYFIYPRLGKCGALLKF